MGAEPRRAAASGERAAPVSARAMKRFVPVRAASTFRTTRVTAEGAGRYAPHPEFAITAPALVLRARCRAIAPDVVRPSMRAETEAARTVRAALTAPPTAASARVAGIRYATASKPARTASRIAACAPAAATATAPTSKRACPVKPIAARALLARVGSSVGSCVVAVQRALCVAHRAKRLRRLT